MRQRASVAHAAALAAPGLARVGCAWQATWVRRFLCLPLTLLLLAMQAADAPQPGFAAWLADFSVRAKAAGIAAATVDRELAGLAFDPRVVALDRAQPDTRSTARPSFAAYLQNHLTASRAERGRARLAAMQPALAAAQARYGVPGPVVVAIWGMETDYGAFTGRFDLIRSFASLAWEGRRRALFERELIAALHLIDRGAVPRARLTGSWAGATGQPQFLPSSFDALAVDGDGDGRADIWGNDADTVASIAHYLAVNGWHADSGWGMPVVVPATLDRARIRALTPAQTCVRPLAQHSRWLTIAEWRALGLFPGAGATWPADASYATLIEPDGPGQGAYLTFGNYRALLAYNCSNFYAFSVGLLADTIAATRH